MSHISHLKMLQITKVLHVFCQEVNEKTKLDAKIILILYTRIRYKKVQISSLYSIKMITFHDF